MPEPVPSRASGVTPVGRSVAAMGATAVLSRESVTVDPGGETQSEVKVRNTGTIVDQYQLEVLGDAAGWTLVEPPTLSLFPGDEGVATLRFRPPRDAATGAGLVPFGVRVASKEDPAGSTVEEGTVEVGRFNDTFAELLPRTAHGRRRARYELAIDNRGNTRVNARLAAADPDNLLRFTFDEPAVVVEPGTAGFAKVTVWPKRRFWRGPPRTIPFQVTAEPEGAPALTADGTMMHEAVIPAWAPKAVAGAAAAVLGLAILWLALLRPSVRSAAKEAARDEAKKELASDAGAAGREAARTAAQQEVAASVGPTAREAARQEVAKQLGTGSAVGGPAIDGRLGPNKSYQVPLGKLLQLTDIVLENPAGEKGTLSVLRNGNALLVLSLENFRDLDYHFVAPPLFKAGDKLELKGDCTNKDCGIYFSGFLVDAI